MNFRSIYRLREKINNHSLGTYFDVTLIESLTLLIETFESLNDFDRGESKEALDSKGWCRLRHQSNELSQKIEWDSIKKGIENFIENL